MATTSWRSSLSNIETRLRRSLGLAGPIDLQLESPPKLTPVIIADDSTRPGTSEQLRGRRWKVMTPSVIIAVGDRGSAWLYADAPYATSGMGPNPFSGGVIVDGLDFSLYSSTTPAAIARVTLCAFPTPLVLNPGLPVAVSPNQGQFIDPTRQLADFPPTGTAAAPALPSDQGGGYQLWRNWVTCDGRQIYKVPCEFMVNFNAAIAFGFGAADPVAPAGGATLQVNWHGRVF